MLGKHDNTGTGHLHNHNTSNTGSVDPYAFVGDAPPPDLKQRELIFDSLQKVVTTPYRTADKATKGTYLFAWGAGYVGQLGHRFNRLQRRYSNIPVPVHLSDSEAGGLTVRQVACGFNHSAMVTDGGHIYTWGESSDKQLGHNEDKDIPQRVPRPPNTFFVQVACGHAHTVAVTDTGLVYAWGQNKYGQLGNLEVQVASEPLLIQSEIVRDVVMAACGARHTVLLTRSGTVISFGSSEHGQTGHGDRHAAAVAAAAIAEAKAAAAQAAESLSSTSGHASGGNNALTSTQHSARGAKSARKDVVAAAAAAAAAAARRSASPASGTSADRTPKVIEALRGIKIVHISCGPMHSFFVSAEGHVYICGFGEFLMPDADQHFFPTPRRVPFPPDVKIVQTACGLGHILALTSTGAVYAWGTSKYGEVGHGIDVDGCPAPRLVLDRTDIHQVAAGRYHSMALSNKGILWSWGCHENGQLGHEGKENECVKIPRVVRSILGMVVGHIACGENHSLAMTSAPWARPAPDVEQLYREAEQEFQIKTELVQAGGQFKGLIKKDRRILREKMEEWSNREAIEAAEEQRRDMEALQRDLSEIRYTDSLQANVLKRVRAIGEVIDETGGQVFVAANPNDATVGSSIAGQLTFGAASARGTGYGSSSRAAGATSGSQTARLRPGVAANEGVYLSAGEGTRELDPAMAQHPALRPYVGPNADGTSGPESSTAQTFVLTNPYAPGPSSSAPRGPTPQHEYPSAQGAGLAQPGVPKSLSTADLLSLPNIRRGPRTLQTGPSTHRGLPSREAHLMKTLPSSQQADAAKQALVAMNDIQLPLASYRQATHQMRADFLKASAQLVQEMTSVIQNSGEEAQTREMRRLANRLLDLRREYDQTREEARKRESQLQTLLQEIERRTQQQTALQEAQKAIDQRVSMLRMRLKTMTIKIAETNDNKENYITNKNKMTEEDYDNEKTIVDLRQTINELTHRTRKYIEAREAALQEKAATEKELHEFHNEIAEYQKFIKAQFAQFQEILNVIRAHNEKREKAKAKKVAEAQRRIEEKRDKLRAEAQLTENDRLALAALLNSHELKLRIFENTFAQLTEATGLNDPDEIIRKFYFKAEIHEQLRRDIQEREQQIARLKQEEEELKQKLANASANYKDRSWKDVEEMTETVREAMHRYETIQKDLETSSQRIALVQEGLVSLVRLLMNNEVSISSGQPLSSTRKSTTAGDNTLDLAQIEQLLERDPLELWRSEYADKIFDRIMRDLDVLIEAEKDHQIRMQTAANGDSSDEIRRRLGSSYTATAPTQPAITMAAFNGGIATPTNPASQNVASANSDSASSAPAGNAGALEAGAVSSANPSPNPVLAESA